jgi:hypothetical protein
LVIALDERIKDEVPGLRAQPEQLLIGALVLAPVGDVPGDAQQIALVVSVGERAGILLCTKEGCHFQPDGCKRVIPCAPVAQLLHV